ncbi:hypothetical protein C9E89_005560, partial [Acinetobacter sichuanensis]
MKRTYLSHLLKAMMSSGILFTAPSLLQVQASDLQIYAGPGTAGQKTLIMMLDRSGSMGVIRDNAANHSIVADYPDLFTYQTCSSGLDENGNSVNRTKFSTETKTDLIFPDISYKRIYCKKNGNPKLYSDRMTRLKDGMFDLLNSTDPKLEKVYIGLGYYSAEDDVSGVIKVPAKELGAINSNHRKDLKKAIAALSAGSSTPTSHAYAEAAAYLLGTTTTNPVYNFVNKPLIEAWYSASNNSYTAYRLCDKAEGETCLSSWGAFVYQPVPAGYTYLKAYSEGGWNKRLYQKNQGTSDIISAATDSGFAKSISTSKNAGQTVYNSPLPTTAATCDGQGVYILSDGQPNNTNDARSNAIMAKALNQTSFSCDVSNGLTN